MVIYVDSREHSGKGKFRMNELVEILRMKNLPVEARYIESGDIVIGNIGIERKTVQDLIFTLQGDRLWQQIKVLKDTYKKPLLIIEGPINYKDKLSLSVLLGIATGWNIPYINTSNLYDTCLVIQAIWDRTVNKNTGPPPAAVKKQKTLKEVRLEMFQCIAGIGPVGAREVLEQFPDFGSCAYNPENVKGTLKRMKLSKKSKELLYKVMCE